MKDTPAARVHRFKRRTGRQRSRVLLHGIDATTADELDPRTMQGFTTRREILEAEGLEVPNA